VNGFVKVGWKKGKGIAEEPSPVGLKIMFEYIGRLRYPFFIWME
jgi:hypothetical protein